MCAKQTGIEISSPFDNLDSPNDWSNDVRYEQPLRIVRPATSYTYEQPSWPYEHPSQLNDHLSQPAYSISARELQPNNNNRYQQEIVRSSPTFCEESPVEPSHQRSMLDEQRNRDSFCLPVDDDLQSSLYERDGLGSGYKSSDCHATRFYMSSGGGSPNVSHDEAGYDVFPISFTF